MADRFAADTSAPPAMASVATASQNDGSPMAAAADPQQSSDSEDLLQRVRNLMRRITAARPSPHPRFLHNLAAILEQEESRFEKDVGHPVSNSARSAHTIGRLVNLIRENDDFFELLSSKLLVESRHSTAVRGAAARLLLACLSCGMYPDVFEDTVLSNIKQWVIEDTPKPTADIPSPKKSGSSKSRNVTSSDWEVLRTYSLGLLAIALTTGGGIIEEMLGSGVAAKLMHFLRVRAFKENANQKEVIQACENRSSGASTVKSRDELRSRVKLPVEVMRIDTTRDGEECSEKPARGKVSNDILEKGGFFEDEDAARDRVSPESFLETLNCTYDADSDRDWMGDETWRRREKRDGKCRPMDPYHTNRMGRDDDLEEAGRGEPSKWRDARDRGSTKIRGKGRVGDGVIDGDKALTSPNAGIRIGLEKPKGLRDRSILKGDTASDTLKSTDGLDNMDDSNSIVPEPERETDEQCVCTVIGDVDISVPVRKAASAAEAEAKTAKASHEAVKAAGEAAADLVKAAALEALGHSLDKEAALAAAISAAATVVDAAAATKAIRKDINLTNQVVQEEREEKGEGELEIAELGDCVLGAEALANLREMYSVQCLERLGEYLEVLGPVLHERGVDVCLALLQRESSDRAHTKDTSMLSDVLKLICALAAHRKFSALFVDRGGVQQILAVPRLPQTYTGISLCLFAFASVQGVMERVCTAPVEVVNEVVSLALHLLECAPDPARRNAALFFGAAFVFRVILDTFDAQDGLCKMLNLLRNAAAVRSGGGSDRAASAEVLTSSEKQIAYHTCVALRQYFRAHLLILVDSLRPYKGRSGLRNITSGRAAYKSLDLSNEAMDALVMQIQRDRKLGPAFVKARWQALEKFMNYAGHIIFLELTQVAPGERYLHDIAQHALGVLHIVTLMPNTRRLIVSSTLSNERSGIAVVLDAASATGYAEPEVIQPALLVLVNLVCPPPSLSRCPMPPHSTPNASQQQYPGFLSGNAACIGEGRERYGKGEGISHKSAGDRPVGTGLDDTKEGASRGEGIPDKSGAGALPGSHSGSVSPAAAVVGDRRICLGSAAGGSGLAAFIEQGYRQARDVVRANNGIKVLLHLLYPRTVLPPTSLDCIRALACRVLLGLARDDAIAHILTKLQVGKLLSELLRDGNGHVGRTAITHAAGDQGRWQAELGQVSMELISLVTNAGRASTLVASDAAAPTLRRIERAAIAAATPISYPARELLQLIHEHLVLSGMPNTASTLLKEAQLVPLPSVSSQMTFSSQSHISDLSQDLVPWPSGRVSNGFFVEALARGDDTSCKSDQAPGSCRKKGPSFSSTLMSSQKPLQSTPSSVKKAPGASRESKQMITRPENVKELHICRARLEDSEYGDTSKTLASTSSVSVKRKLADSDFTMNKRLSVSDSEGPLAALRYPESSKSSQAHDSGSLLASTLRPNQRGAFSRQEKSDLSCLQIDKLAGVESHEIAVSPFGAPSHLHASVFHASLVSEPLSCQTERATLDSLVVQYLKHQHRQCPAPITTLPPLSLFHPHTCPEPSRVCYAPLNTAGRLAVREMIPPFGGTQGRRRDRHFVYSRFRPLRPCRDERVLLTCTTFLGTTFCLAAASHAGEVRLFDCHSGNLLETHACHQSPITLLQSTSGELGDSVEFSGSQPGHLLLSSGSSDARLWNSSTLSNVPLYSFDGCRSARFNHSGSMFAAISTESAREVLLYDVQTGKLEQRLSDSSLSSTGVLRGNAQCIVHFNPSDSLLLWNGVLWDHRVPRAIHRFDQFTDYGGGGFHPAGNEVIINSEVWDLRSFKLLRSVPSLDQTVISFNSTGDVIYATLRRNSEDITSALHPRRGRHPLFSAFRTMDAVDYTDIATTSVDRCILDLATEPSDSLISVVALDGHDEMDSLAKLYEVGRRKPTDDDSDPDDGAETEDDEDSFAEEEAAEEEDLHGDEDDSDVDGSNDEDGSGDEEDAEADVDTNEEEDDDDDAVEVDGSIVEIITDGEDDDARISYSSDEDGSLDDFDDEYNEMLQDFF